MLLFIWWGNILTIALKKVASTNLNHVLTELTFSEVEIVESRSLCSQVLHATPWEPIQDNSSHNPFSVCAITLP